MATAVLASIGDQGVLNTTLSEEQSAVWLDRDLKLARLQRTRPRRRPSTNVRPFA